MRLRLGMMVIVLVLGLVACFPQPTPPALPEELIFYDWANDVPREVLTAFTAEYGIKVRYETYDSTEEAFANIEAGKVYDVAVIDSRFIPRLREKKLLARLNHANLPNLENISADFRNPAFDPGNVYTVPFNWGTVGMVVRSDLISAPVKRWADLWDPRYAGKIGLWREGATREIVGLTLISLGYSCNTVNEEHLEKALQRLLELRPHVVFLEDCADCYATSSPIPALLRGDVIIALGYAAAALEGQEASPNIGYVLPAEGTIIWNDNFVIPASTTNQEAAELLLNYLLRGETAAAIANFNFYATPNVTALKFLNPKVRDNPVIYPTNLKNAEMMLPLTEEADALYLKLWQRFVEGQ